MELLVNNLTTNTEEENKSDQGKRLLYQAANVSLQFFNTEVSLA